MNTPGTSDDDGGVPMHVLVVDDNDDIRLLLRMMLSARGCQVHEAIDGPSALEAIGALRPPDLVLLDIRIPPPNGLEVLERVRAAGTESRIVLLSAQSDVEVGRQQLVAQADGVLAKPFAVTDLYDTIDRVMTANRGG